MPKRKREPAGASTARVKRLRVRKKLRKLVAEHDSFIFLDLQNYCQGKRLEPGTWVLAKDFFSNGYLLEHQATFLAHEFSGVDSGFARIGGAVVKIIRPKFLGETSP